jgi:hypothetical protein
LRPWAVPTDTIEPRYPRITLAAYRRHPSERWGIRKVRMRLSRGDASFRWHDGAGFRFSSAAEISHAVANPQRPVIFVTACHHTNTIPA